MGKNNSNTDLKRAFSEDGAHKTHIGGQALIEGVMMRGSQTWAVAVREPDGALYTEENPLSKKGNRSAWFSWPLVRGCVALVDSLTLGYKALEIAANHAFEDEEEGSLHTKPQDQSTACADEQESSNQEKEPFFGKAEMLISAVLGITLGIALFVFFPALVSNLLVGDYDTNVLAWNIVDGIARVAIFIFYVWLIGRMKEIKRMFAYHGAEHKTIHCFEHGLELTPENARSFPRLHVRCGTAFLIMVMIIAILVYTIVPIDMLLVAWGVTDSLLKFILVIVVRIALMPLIAGLSYEITVKWAGSRPDNPLVKVILWPGMQMQRLTTNEPDDSQLECAIAAMKLVIAQEEKAAN